jgi:hypothetical protein
LVLAQPQPGPNNAGTATQPVITSAGVNQLTFSVTAPAAATNIVWTVNGVTQSTTGVASGASTWTWGISGLPDGVYRVGAAAQSATGTVGPTTTIFVKLIRSAPPAPVVTGYGFNPNVYVNNALVSSPVAEVQWSPVPNVAGYRVYSPASSTTPMCQITTPPFATSCIDFNPPGNSNLTYKVVALYTDANNSLLESPNAASVTLTGVQSTTYSFAPTLATGSNCLSGAYDMHASYTPAATDTSTAGSTYITSATFCSDLLSAGQAVPGSFSATAWFTNATNQSCTVNATVNINGGLGLTTTASVPAGNSSTYSQATFNWNWGQNVAISAGSRINVQFSWSSCGTRQKPLTMYWGSAAHAGTYHSLPTLSPPPNTPTALAVTRNASGVATLTWTPPSTGTSVYFYRVYRDGRNYTNRIAWADPVANCTSTQCTLNDPTPDTAQHTYYITAVGGTTPGSNMAESAMTAGVTR